MTTDLTKKQTYASDKIARSFLILAMSYLLFGLLLGVIGGFQYILPSFLKNKLSFQQTRPLHVYLVITWIFTGAQAGLYYYLPRICQRKLYWEQGAKIHLLIQILVSVLIVYSFFMGEFGGREYLEFPPWLGAFMLLSWIPFVINFFFTLKPNYKNAPVYVWSWSTGILFFFITLSESYLWLIDYFHSNIIRDVTVQWKALGSMVGSWNMLVYGTGMYIMEKMSGDTKACRSPLAFFFYFLGLTNLMFNWGHHTYIVPAAPWIKMVAYIISMTELLILGYIIMQWRKTMSKSRKNYHRIPYRLLSFADGWIFLNLILAIAISVPAWNNYTHGTHITVAHAMGATIGINTMLLLASVYYILQQEGPAIFEKKRKITGTGILVTNFALLLFWVAMLGSGLVKISSKLNNETFYKLMQKSQPWFKFFTYSGTIVFAGLFILIVMAISLMRKKPEVSTLASDETGTAPLSADVYTKVSDKNQVSI
ncbi:MAG: cbb3-type cytochrome c oxidase subunit I [Chitinophagaceae bacterium]|nr:cbb3-type cytochrome c oxidase subunit I [Chitinophagaceae bacterium]MBK8299930.1 cbb3-type cytochrome c oxidase subunit I [Chitinophagaceae bacterium]MBL0067354.1 cbb3-type cytochrome c oxidase subunit I [Chitinophagaceae bacterium]